MTITKATAMDRERPFHAVATGDKCSLVLEGADDAALSENFKGRPENGSDARKIEAIVAPDWFKIR